MAWVVASNARRERTRVQATTRPVRQVARRVRAGKRPIKPKQRVFPSQLAIAPAPGAILLQVYVKTVFASDAGAGAADGGTDVAGKN